MKRTTKQPIWSAWLALVVLALACNLPSGTSGTPDFSATAAAETVQAQLTSAATQPSPTGLIPLPTNTGSVPTLTPAPTTVPASATSNCDVAQFVTDVTIPDGEDMAPGEAFTKTWRFKNVGTCSWTPSYAIVFSSGNSMSGPATQALTGNVNPGQTVDISVNLTAPGSAGDYTSYWKLRNASGVLFAQFYVEIEVTEIPALPPAIAQVVLTTLSGEDGHANSAGAINPNPNTGDSSSNETLEAFVSFDMTGIPAGATIVSVEADFSDYDILGNPWGISDGCVRAYAQNYGTLDASDFFVGDPLGALANWCSVGELNTSAIEPDMKAAVQNRVGTSRMQMRIQFRTPTTNSNGVADAIRFGAIQLIVTYQ